MTFWVIKHPKSQTVKLYFTAKTEDKLSNSGFKIDNIYEYSQTFFEKLMKNEEITLEYMQERKDKLIQAYSNDDEDAKIIVENILHETNIYDVTELKKEHEEIITKVKKMIDRVASILRK
jgi:hypothetical protein